MGNTTQQLFKVNYQLLNAKFRYDLKKVGKTTRPFRYDLNQIPNDYTVEVRNRFKGLDMIDRVPEELWMEVSDIIQETGIKSMSFLVAFSVFSINTKYFSFNCPDL